MKARCNPGCKGTVFEEGPRWLSHKKNGLQKKLQQINGKNTAKKGKKTDNKETSRYIIDGVIPEWKKERKEIMKETKGKVLNKNSFYRAMRTLKKGDTPNTWEVPKERKKNSTMLQERVAYKKQEKKKGVLSGCHRYILPDGGWA